MKHRWQTRLIMSMEKATKLACALHVIDSVRFQTICHCEGLGISADSAHGRNDSVGLGRTFAVSYYIGPAQANCVNSLLSHADAEGPFVSSMPLQTKLSSPP